MARPFVEGQQKFRNLNIFQLCSAIFPTMITVAQIIDLSAKSTLSVENSAFHHEWYRNYIAWCRRIETNEKIRSFQLYSIIFPTMITRMQIISVLHHPL